MSGCGNSRLREESGPPRLKATWFLSDTEGQGSLRRGSPSWSFYIFYPNGKSKRAERIYILSSRPWRSEGFQFLLYASLKRAGAVRLFDRRFSWHESSV